MKMTLYQCGSETKGTLTILTALSRSQSLKIMRGDLPPNSRETFFTLLIAQLQGTNAHNSK